jgi:hypothetical protein
MLPARPRIVQRRGGYAAGVCILFGQFTFAMCRGRNEDAAPLAQLFLKLATDKSYDSGRVIGYRLCGMTHINAGAASMAKEQLEQSLELYSAERDAAATQLFGQNTQVHSRSLLSIALLCIGQVDEALKVGLDALETADALRHPQSTALARAYVGGWLFGLCGAKNEMMREARQLIALSEQHRLVRSACSGQHSWVGPCACMAISKMALQC